MPNNPTTNKGGKRQSSGQRSRGGGWRQTNQNSITGAASSSAKKLERLERFGSDTDIHHSGGWRRQQQVHHDASGGLENYGFVSKGDERLKDLRNQELYHKHVSQKYLSFCGTSTSADQLESEFAALALTPLNNPRSTATPSNSKNAVYNDIRNGELSSILLCMRKLREGIVASRRVDKFAVEVFMQHIRAAILVQQRDNYHPALLHLLYTLHPALPLQPLDTQEFASYHMLHAAAAEEDYGSALAIKHEFGITDRRATQAVAALIHGNYWSYRAARNRVDQYVGRLMDYAEDRMRRLMLKCMGATYHSIDLAHLEIVAGMAWKRLQEDYSVGWELESITGTVTIKRSKGKAKPPAPVPAPAPPPPKVERVTMSWADEMDEEDEARAGV